ncbi:MAG: serine hydrolase domain-containing protein, partial [Acidobacteriota bacterium]
VPGLSIAVLEDGEIAWAAGYGVVRAGEEAPVTPQTLFLAGSISKPVAATGALRLVQEGTVELDADVNDLLESWKVPASDAAAGKPVTLRGLLTHTAGLTVHGFPGYPLGAELPTVPEILDSEGVANTGAVRVDLEPGTQWRYSGGGYTVMQLLVEDVADRPFEDFLAASVLGPFGMTRSTFENPLPEARHDEAAIAHFVTGTPVPSKWHSYPEMAAAGLWTTASDLALWARGIQRAAAGESDVVLDQKMAQQMLTAGMGDWGLGPAVRGEGGEKTFSHGGRDQGFDAQLTAFVEGGHGAALMINTNNNTGFLREVLDAIARAHDWPGERRQQRGYVEIDAARLDAIAGVYDFSGDRFTLRHTDGKLYGFMKDAPRLELYAEDASTFFFTNAPGTLVVEAGDGGEVTGFAWTRRGETRRATKQKSP